jgi:NADH-quinone oxidoreductase subunit G
VAAAGLAKSGAATGVLTGGRITIEDAQAYAAFARQVLGTNDVDFRARSVSNEETAFLANQVAGTKLNVTYGDLEAAASVLLVGFEPEDESPIVFLRLRKAAIKGNTKVYSVAPFASAGLAKMNGELLVAGPREEVSVITNAAANLSGKNSIILVGERAAQIPGALKAVVDLAQATGARLAWIPRRAGDRGALDAGLLPIGGRNTTEIIAATGTQVKGLLIGGVSPEDVPSDLLAAITRANFVVSLETRHTEVTALADVVLPVAVVTEKNGTFRNWEGRDRSFKAVIPTAGAISDAAVLGEIATEFGKSLSVADYWSTVTKPALVAQPASALEIAPGQAVLSSWRHLLDKGALQSDEPFLAATARVAVVRLSPTTAKTLNLIDGVSTSVTFAENSASAPLVITAGMADDVVWVPANSEGSSLNLPSGCLVSVSQVGS